MGKQKEKTIHIKLYYNNKIVEQIRFKWKKDIVELFGRNGWFPRFSRLKRPYLEELALLKIGKET